MAIIILKLTDGTEVVGAHIGETPRFVTLQDPLLINYRLPPYQAMPTVSMSRYVPFADEPTFNFDKADIKHQVVPKPALIHYYNYSIKNFREHIDKSIEQQMVDAVPTEVEEDNDSVRAEMYKQFLQKVNLDGPMN
jgi:hypothetical protein